MRIVADTNVWLRAVIRKHAYPGQVLDAWLAGRFELVTSEELLAEIADVFSRPKLLRKTGFTPEQVKAFVDRMRRTSVVVPIPGTLKLCRDPNDDMVIETALEGRALLIVTQDEDLLSMTIPRLAVVTAEGFMRGLDRLKPAPQPIPEKGATDPEGPAA